ncbi:MAG TPA: preprotein translocase subunit SecE [Acidimicrobiia bacterium]|nr:preprotein translocase subunit SecE [Acidimicrobiia bacterium]
MNREMRRLMEREERRQKKQDQAGGAASRRAQAASRAPQVERKSLWERVRSFFHDVRQEMRKVSWPTREQMIAFTTVTLITTVVLTVVVFGLDVAMKEVVLFVVERSQ